MLEGLDVHKNYSTNSTNSTNSTIVSFGHSLNTSVAVAIATYFILLIVGGVIFNAVLIHIILLKKRLKSSSNSFIEQQHSTTNTFVVNLAVCDLLTAVSTLPFDADFLLRGYYAGGIFFCGLKETFFMFALPASVVNLLLLTAERFVKLLYPFAHRKIFTKIRVAVLILASWTYILVVALLPIMIHRNAVNAAHGHCSVQFSMPYTIFQLVGNFSIPVVVILSMNAILYYYVGKRAHAIELRKSDIRRQRDDSRTTSTKRRARFSKALPLNFRAAKTIMTLVGVFLVCWITFIISVSVNIMCNICLPREITWIVSAVNYSSVALNPVIYGLQNKSIRRMAVKTYFRCLTDGVESQSSMHRSYSSFRSTMRKHSNSFWNLFRNPEPDKNESLDVNTASSSQVVDVVGTHPVNYLTNGTCVQKAYQNEAAPRVRSSSLFTSIKQYLTVNSKSLTLGEGDSRTETEDASSDELLTKSDKETVI